VSSWLSGLLRHSASFQNYLAGGIGFEENNIWEYGKANFQIA